MDGLPLWAPKRSVMLQSCILAESFPPFLRRVNERVPWPAQDKTALLFMLGRNSISTASLVIRSIYRDIVESDTTLPVENMVCYCPMQNWAHLEEKQHNPRILSRKSSLAERGKLFSWEVCQQMWCWKFMSVSMLRRIDWKIDGAS